MAMSWGILAKAGGAIGLAAAIGYGARKLSGPGGAIEPGSPRAAPVTGEGKLPETAEVVIVGGGIVGACAAFFLAEKGVNVVLCEKGAIAGEASGRAQGQVSSAGLDPGKLDLIALSKQLWNGFSDRIEGEIGYRRNGLISPCADLKALGIWEEWLASSKGGAPEARILSASEANRVIPSSTQWVGALYDPSDGGVEPTLAASTIVEAARKRGARIVAPCAVRGLETTGGRVSGAVTEMGTIRTSNVLLAGGCWSGKFLSSLGIAMPSLNVFSSLSRATFANPPTNIPANFDVPGAIVRRHIDGSFSLGATKGRLPVTPGVLANLHRFAHVIFDPPWDVNPHFGAYFFSELMSPARWELDEISPFEKNRILQPMVNLDLLDGVQASIAAAFPQFGAMTVHERWAGALTVLPDNIPVLGAVPGREGLYLATGFTYGMTMGPAAAKLVAQLLMGDTPELDLHMYRYSRFTDGSKLAFTH
jgi:glycine/D-amino acid oxidase-like deaminating enzyme